MFLGRLELEKIEKWLNSKGVKDLEFDLKSSIKDEDSIVIVQNAKNVRVNLSTIKDNILQDTIFHFQTIEKDISDNKAAIQELNVWKTNTDNKLNTLNTAIKALTSKVEKQAEDIDSINEKIEEDIKYFNKVDATKQTTPWSPSWEYIVGEDQYYDKQYLYRLERQEKATLYSITNYRDRVYKIYENTTEELIYDNEVPNAAASMFGDCVCVNFTDKELNEVIISLKFTSDQITTLYKSIDGGKTWTSKDLDLVINNMHVIPTNKVIKFNKLYYFMAYARNRLNFSADGCWRSIYLVHTEDFETFDGMKLADFSGVEWDATITPSILHGNTTLVSEPDFTITESGHIFYVIRAVGNVGNQYNKLFWLGFGGNIIDPLCSTITDGINGNADQPLVPIKINTAGGHLQGALPRITYVKNYLSDEQSIKLVCCYYNRCFENGNEDGSVYLGTIDFECENLNTAMFNTKASKMTFKNISKGIPTGKSSSPLGGNGSMVTHKDNIIIVEPNVYNGTLHQIMYTKNKL